MYIHICISSEGFIFIVLLCISELLSSHFKIKHVFIIVVFSIQETKIFTFHTFSFFHFLLLMGFNYVYFLLLILLFPHFFHIFPLMPLVILFNKLLAKVLLGGMGKWIQHRQSQTYINSYCVATKLALKHFWTNSKNKEFQVDL